MLSWKKQHKEQSSFTILMFKYITKAVGPICKAYSIIHTEGGLIIQTSFVKSSPTDKKSSIIFPIVSKLSFNEASFFYSKSVFL
jgi:hypothetical protein